MASRVKFFMHIPEYQDAPYRNYHQAQKILRAVLKGYYLEPKAGDHAPRLPKWWWLQKNFAQLQLTYHLRGTLIIIREKKGTRRGKSLYYQTLREKGVYPRERNVPPTPAFRIGGRPVVAVATGRRPATGGIFNFDPFAEGHPLEGRGIHRVPATPEPMPMWGNAAQFDMDGNVI